MTCRDCIHWFSCDSSGGEIYADEQTIRDDCPNFMRASNTVEVVRCKDCKHIETTEYGGYCCKLCIGVAYNHYCSYGERREENEG